MNRAISFVCELGSYGFALVLTSWKSFRPLAWWQAIWAWREVGLDSDTYVMKVFWLYFIVKVGGRWVERRKANLRRHLPKWRV